MMSKFFLFSILLFYSIIAFSQVDITSEELDETIKICDRELEKRPNDELYLMARGDAFMIKAEYNSALNDYFKLSSINNKSKEVNYKIGRAFLELGKYDAAIKNFSIAIELDSLYYNSYLDRGIAYNNIKLHDKALSDYFFIAEHTNSLEYLVSLNMGISYLYLNNFIKAEEFLLHTLELEKERYFVYFYLSALNLKTKNLDKICYYFLISKEKGLPENFKDGLEIIDNIKDYCK